MWLCRRCLRIQIWDQNDKYVCYRKGPFSGEITTDELFRMEEWLAYSDWDLEDDRTVAEALIHPFRPHRYFLSPDKQKIYVLNTDLEEIVRAKFTQNPKLGEQLLSTGNAVLIEGNTWNDRY